MERKKEYFKYASYFLLAFILNVIFYSRGTSLYKIGVDGDLGIMLIVAIAMYEGASTGAGAGFIYSLLICAQRAGLPFGPMFFYTILGALSGHMMVSDFRRHIVSAQLFTVLGALSYCILAFLGRGVFISLPLETFLIATAKYILISMLFGIPIYLAVKTIYTRFNEEKE